MGTQLYLLVVLVCLMNIALAQRITRPGCPYRCEGSDIPIPYPFGIGPDCARDETFIITCNITSLNLTRPFMSVLGFQVLSIDLDQSEVRVENPELKSIVRNLLNHSQFLIDVTSTTVLNWTTRGNCSGIFGQHRSISGLPFDEDRLGRTNSCSPDSYCYINDDSSFGTGTHFSCHCPTGFEGNPYLQDGCQDRYDCKGNSTCSSNSFCYDDDSSPRGYSCYCESGYEGDPYVPNGCKDIDECEDSYNKEHCTKGCVNTHGSFICKRLNKKIKAAIIGVGSSVGTVIFLLCLWWVYKKIKRTRKIQLKRKFFKRNGGLLLEKQLSSGEEGNVQKSKLFTSKDLEMATDRYNKNRILGQGGQGTVYKGMLTDGRIVAIKVSTIVDEGNVEEFINEVVILSQINHRNVVKLHGCCLETEVPLLVYEFIPNGTLFDYIHNENEDFPLSWNVRLRIATEVASAISYLHSAASLPIYHRDIKSTNILLDEKYKAKVADFGTSRSISIDQTHLTTRVSGTFGYLDPEYFQSSQFTDKSDVYSFGVVLVELLTSQKPISSTRSEESRSLTTYFMVASEENRLYDILDAQVQKEGGKEEITRVANLAKRCLNLSGRKRPTMREVRGELEAIRKPNGAISTINEQGEEGEYDIIESTHMPFESTSNSGFCSDFHPLLIE